MVQGYNDIMSLLVTLCENIYLRNVDRSLFQTEVHTSRQFILLTDNNYMSGYVYNFLQIKINNPDMMAQINN